MRIERSIALLLALLMLFALAACGESESAAGNTVPAGVQDPVQEATPAAEPEPEPTPEPTHALTVVGLWETEIDMRDSLVEIFDSSRPDFRSFGLYLDSFVWVMTMELGADGRYTLSIDVSRDLDAVKSAFENYIRDLLNSSAVVTLSDEAIAQQLGMPLEDYAEQLVNTMILSVNTQSGTYSDRDGCLIWGSGEIFPYTLTEDTLTFSAEPLGVQNYRRIG